MEVQKMPGYRKGSIYYTCSENEGFYYLRKSVKSDTVYLSCVEKDCPARAKCNDSVFLTFHTDKHNHLADPSKKEALLLKQEMLQNAVGSSNSIRTIFVANSASASENAASKLAFPAVGQAMRRHRQQCQPKTPHTLQEYGDACQENRRFGYIDEKLFCRGVVGQGVNVSVLFLAEGLEDLLLNAKEIHLDGTFKTRPRYPDSSQLLTIHAIQYGIAFPCAFALMANRSTASYNGVFSSIKAILPSLNPRLIITDFEMSLIRSLTENFEQATKTGCYFHYCQAVMRQASVLRMKNLLKINTNARKAFQFLLCLPLLPSVNIEEGIQCIKNMLNQNHLEEEFETLLKYHDRQWMRRVGSEVVSVFNRSRRTNNDSESFHATLQRHLRVRGPNTWEFTDGLRELTATTVRELRAFVNQGLQIRCLQKRKYRLNNKRIVNATQQFLRDRNVRQFLNMVCHTANRMVELDLADERETTVEEQHILLPLAADVPANFITDVNEDTSDEEEQEDAVNETDDNVAVAINDETVCMICNQAPPTTLLRPCNHFGLCDECRDEMQHRANEYQRPDEELGYRVNYSICPVDRIQITEYIIVRRT